MLAVAAYLIAFVLVAFLGEATAWWWWFVPVFGTVKIWGANVMLGMFHAGILLVVLVSVLLVRTLGRDVTRYGSRQTSA